MKPSQPSEFEMRNGFIELDVKAKKLGGVDKLFVEHQRIYIDYGRATGFLSQEEANELAREPGLESLISPD